MRPYQNVIQKRPTIVPGVFHCPDRNGGSGLQVEVCWTRSDGVSIKMGAEENPTLGINKKSAAVLSKFFGELSEILEA
jgi:hypothetical protein